MTVRIIAVEATDLFAGTEQAPEQVVRVTLEGGGHVVVSGPGVHGEATVTASTQTTVDVPLSISGASTGTELPLTVHFGSELAQTTMVVAEPGWTMFLVSHFHYDPVWWNTQAAYTSPWELLSGDATTRPLWERNGFALVEAHLDLALRDPIYKFVLAEIDYLKPFFDLHPHRRDDLRLLMRRGQVELVGGTYNEPNTNLTGAETTIRNIVYGIGYQRDILGGEPQTAWQLDVFGHDPQFPGYLASAGLTGSAWARGPFHQWGPIRRNFREARNDATVMQFPSEFEWISPSGEGVLTHFMPHHYSAGWWMDSAPDLAAAEQAVYELYRKLKPVAATKNLLLPVGTDYTPPNKWVTAIHRSWTKKYVWPRFVCGTPRDFLDAVRAELATSKRRPSPQTRDMNPIYTGKDVSYIDTKQAQRAGETAAVDAEKLATLAALAGLGSYPHAALDKVWRQLAYGAHHDAITGSESDQVYIDLLSGWREAYDLASAVIDASLGAFAGQIDTSGDGTPIVVTNTLSFERTALVAVRLPAHVEGGRLVDDSGADVPSLVDRGVLRFQADRVPPLGWRTWRFVPGDRAVEPVWEVRDGWSIENEHFEVAADSSRGGGLSLVYDKAAARSLLRDGHVGNELRVYEEYPTHPDFGEGPWHLAPKGPVVGASERPAIVRAETSTLGQRLVISGEVDSIGYEQTVTLWHGVDRVDCRTRILRYGGADRLIRVRFPVDLPGALPVSEVASAVVGRGFALPDVDAAEAPWTLDNPANTWFGLSSTARVDLVDPQGTSLGARALGVAEVVVPTLDEAAEVRDLVVALARGGVTATTAAAGWSRYGWLDVDSNLPDFRILVGGPEVNDATRELLERAGEDHSSLLKLHGRVWVPGEKSLNEVWQPNADLRDLRSLPALVVLDVAALTADLDDAVISAVCAVSPQPSERLTDHTVALLTYGLPGFAVDPSGAMHLSLMRSCTGWPSGVWIDPPKRTLPDGASFQLQHWTHQFRYALVSGEGDWRSLALPSQGQEFNHPLYARVATAHEGSLPSSHSYLRVDPPRSVLLNTLKPAGNPIAHGSGAHADPSAGITIRLAEATGMGGEARIGGALGLTELYSADLLEKRLSPLAETLALTGSQVATILATPAARASAGAGPLGPAAEVAQPIHARYWLHNRGPAPMGYLPVSVAVSPGLITQAPAALSVVLSSHLTDVAVEGVLTVIAPQGWNINPGTRPYRLDPQGHLSLTATVTPPESVRPGLYFATARTVHDGQTVEDVATIAIGELPSYLPVAGEAPEDWAAAQGTKATTARDTGLDVDVTQPSLRLQPGTNATLGVALTNRTRGEVRGELQLVSPWGTWDCVAAPIQGFALSAGASATVGFEVTVPQDADPGSYWALAKVMWFGRCQYAPTVELVIAP